MLSQLTVTNFAIIDNITIDFDNYLNVITGETGAGKSLIIDAIGLLLGDRASLSMIRTSFDKASIEGLFTNYNKEIDVILNELGIDTSDELIIRREIYRNGKSISRINGYTINLNQLLQISILLADIHTQLDTKKLFECRNYVDFIDNDKTLSILTEYQNHRKSYLQKLKEYNHLLKVNQEAKDNLDFYLYRYNELKSLNLDINEKASLEEELKALNNYENIYQNLSEIVEGFNDHNIISALHLIKMNLSKLANYQESYQKLLAIVDSCYYDLDDVKGTIVNNLSHLEFDNKRLDYINERLSVIREIERKYHMNIAELIDYQKQLEDLINNQDQSAYLIEKAKKEVEDAFSLVLTTSHNLTNIRKDSALQLITSIHNTLKDLCLDKVQMDIIVNENLPESFLDQKVFKDKGLNDVEILISFNVGEDLKPLSKIASGGEMSRVMLALKTHLLENVHLSTIIFDEIDSGISGEVALAVAKKLKEISKTTQVLTITHLPIVASAADSHLLVEKEVKDDKTYTSVTKLEKDERIRKIAEIISSKKDEITSLILAENMINSFK